MKKLLPDSKNEHNVGLTFVGCKECISTWRAGKRGVHGNPTRFQRFEEARESLQLTEDPIWS